MRRPSDPTDITLEPLPGTEHREYPGCEMVDVLRNVHGATPGVLGDQVILRARLSESCPKEVGITGQISRLCNYPAPGPPASPPS